MDLREAERLANQLMRQHGLTQLGWTFRFDRAKCRLGLCSFRYKQISLSRTYTQLNDVKLIHDTILHEIAHAKVGPKHGHDNTWKVMALSVGARPLACKGRKHGLIQPETEWYSVCSKCKLRMPSYSRPRFKGKEYFHTPCGRDSKIVWFHNGTELTDYGVPVVLIKTLKAAAEQSKSETEVK